MKIDIEKSNDHYRADCKDLPGSPPVGLGDTPEEAVACLFWRILFEGNWHTYIPKDEPIIVNGKKWDWPESYRRN